MSNAKLDRRGFLAGAAGLTGVALAVGAWKPVFAMEDGLHDDITAGHSNFKIGQIALTLNGATTAGSLLEAEGGAAFTDVNIQEGGGIYVQKIPGRLKWQVINLKRGITADTQFNTWIRDSLGGKPTSLNGSITGADENFKVFTQTDFFNALITEVGFPALDAASKDAAKMTIKIQPESTRTAAGSGKVQRFKFVNGWPSKLSIGNFKLTIGGMNTDSVTGVDAITVKLNYAAGDAKAGPRLVSIDAENVKIRIPEAKAHDFVSWHQDFVINGNNSPENEKHGSLSLLGPDLKTEFFRLDFSGLGIFALDADPLTLSGDTVRHVTAQLYCDKVIYNFKL